MAKQNAPNFLEQNIYGIILRISSIFSSRYAYFPLPRIFPTKDVFELDNIITDSLANAPHFHDINILDSVYSNNLYQTYNSFPNFFHVYNLINQSHFALSFPYHLTFFTATILICDCSRSCFNVLVVCINEHPNSLFAKDGDNKTRPLVFYLYTSKRKNWSLVPNDHNLTYDHLLPNRRSPAYFGGDIVYIDLTNHFVITYDSMTEKIKVIPKLVSTWEQGSSKLDEATRYGKCKGRLHCVKFNTIKVRIEVYIWLESPIESWRLVETGKSGRLGGKVLGIHPNDEGFLLVRSTVKDEVLMFDIQRDLSCVVINGRGVNCRPECFLHGMNEVLKAAISEGLQHSSCGILHPHENIEGPEGEVFIVSHFGFILVSPP